MGVISASDIALMLPTAHKCAFYWLAFQAIITRPPLKRDSTKAFSSGRRWQPQADGWGVHNSFDTCLAPVTPPLFPSPPYSRSLSPALARQGWKASQKLWENNVITTVSAGGLLSPIRARYRWKQTKAFSSGRRWQPQADGWGVHNSCDTCLPQSPSVTASFRHGSLWHKTILLLLFI